VKPAVQILESALAIFTQISTVSNELFILAEAGFIFIPWLIMLYKKGHWLSIPPSVASILVVVMWKTMVYGMLSEGLVAIRGVRRDPEKGKAKITSPQ
jgi:hypothetical protein